MKRKRLYLAPAIATYPMATRRPLLDGSPKAGYMTSPDVGGTDEDDVIGTESRRTGHGIWDE